ncbi:peptidase domain-containing ABC transporter [Myxococcus sp. AM010]|uniref:peptidase domain-containing ABC transporter n=1 Tax=Myxococcus sp. AM010 TaxID=2745138 RepID=UPI0015959432|nr:ATP-binding cassette domain-containing protein [Myxococcus sp. AM010]NVJ13114.1 ATP-binding cassette domain-containing protein [Myxococcus sp. AM010]
MSQSVTEPQAPGAPRKREGDEVVAAPQAHEPNVARPDGFSLEALLPVLEALGAPAGVTVEAQAVQRWTRGESAAAARAWPERLASACEAVGLRAVARRASVREVMTGEVPLPVALLGPEGWCLVTARRPGQVLVHARGVALPDWVGGPALIAAVGAETPAQPLDWTVAVPAAPLERLGGGDPHGHGDHPTPMQRLRSLLWLERDDLKVVLVYAVAAGLLSLATPVAVQALVNTVTFGTLLQPLVVLSILVMAALAFAATLRALNTHVVEVIQQRMFARVALDASHRIPRVRQETFDRDYGPELVNRFFDVLTLQKTLSIFLLEGVSLVLQALIGMVVLAFYHPVLLAFDLVLIAATAFIILVLGQRGTATAIEESKAKYAVAAWLEELARHPLAFRSRDGAVLAEEQADVLTRRYLGARRRHFSVVFRQVVGSLGLQVVASALLLGLGGWLVIQRQLTLGQLVAAELIVTTVLTSFVKFGKHVEAFYDLQAALDKLGHLVDLPLEEDGPHREPLPEDRDGLPVRVEGVHFSHGGGRAALTGLKLELAPGEKVALLAPSGGGKSTLADLLFGLRQPTRGRLAVGGVDTRRVSLAALRSQVALVRGVEVLVGSVLDNVRAGRAAVGPSEARRALAAVGLLEAVLSLPRGLDTPLGPTGAPLSSGQVRRLMVARALAGAPRLIVLDEVLEGLSERGRQEVMDSLLAPEARWTLVVLASEEDAAVRRVDRRHTLAELMAGSSPEER